MRQMQILGQLFGVAFATFGLEIPIAGIFFGMKKKVITVCFLINMITNLTLNTLLLSVGAMWPDLYYVFMGALEIAVVVIETILWRWALTKEKLKAEVTLGRCFFLSVCANVFSFVVGLFFTNI